MSFLNRAVRIGIEATVETETGDETETHQEMKKTLAKTTVTNVQVQNLIQSKESRQIK